MTFRNRLTATIAAATLAAALAACSNSSPEAGRPDTAPPTASTSTPSESPSATSSPSPQVTAPTSPPMRPSAAGGLTLAAAESFVRYYVDLLNYASATGDAAPMLDASDPGCNRCRLYADFVAKSNAKNGGLSGDYLETVKDISALAKGENGHAGGTAVVSIGAYVSKKTPTAKPVTNKAATYNRVVALAPSHGNWVMFEMKLAPR